MGKGLQSTVSKHAPAIRDVPRRRRTHFGGKACAQPMPQAQQGPHGSRGGLQRQPAIDLHLCPAALTAEAVLCSVFCLVIVLILVILIVVVIVLVFPASQSRY